MKKIFLILACFLGPVLAAHAGGLKEEKSTHFVIYYQETVPLDFVGTVVEYAERYYDELTQRLGFTRFNYWTWDNRAKIYIYGDHDAYLKETKQPSWSSGVADYSRKTIWTFPREAGFFDSLLPHEIGHIVFREVIGSRRVPLWLEEGVASYLEQAKRFGAEKTVLDALAANTFIPLAELSKIDAHDLKNRPDIVLFYAESVSLVSYLIDKFGVERFNYFCEKIKDGRPFDDALAYAYFDIRSENDLAQFWERYLKDKAKVKSAMVL